MLVKNESTQSNELGLFQLFQDFRVRDKDNETAKGALYK
jgi:hypothetical protein